MPNIQLQAKLQAYSRAPFYTDWVRDVTSIEGYDPSISYVRTTKDGITTWEKIDTTLCDEDKLAEFIRDIATDTDYAKSIKIVKPRSSYDESNPEAILPGNAFGFYNWNDELTIVQFPYLYAPDHKTIGVKMDEASGEGYLYVVDTPDGLTLKVGEDHKIYAESLVTSDGIILGTTIRDKLLELEANVDDLIQIIQGKGGFLDPHDFGTTEPTEEELHNYYRDYILEIYHKENPNASIEDDLAYIEANPIPDQTKIKNLYDGAVWIYSDGKWYNDGAEVVVAANNNGVLGVVTGSTDKYKVSIDTNEEGQSLGTMTVNGVEEEFTKVVYVQENLNESLSQAYVQTPGENQVQQLLNISTNEDTNTLVQRTSDGYINCDTPQDYDNVKNVVNIEWINNWFETNAVTDDEIDELIKETLSSEEVTE